MTIGVEVCGGAGVNLVTVDSSMLYAVGYDPDTQELVAVFNSGRTWWYEGVPAEVYQQLMSSDSIGGYMRDRAFSFSGLG